MKQRWRSTLFVALLGCSFSMWCCEINSVAEKKTPEVILITGGAGFIGSNFLRYMFDKYSDYSFIILDALTYAGSLENIPLYIRQSPRFDFVYGSITDSDLVDQCMARAHYVVHLAAETHVSRSIFDDKIFLETDVMGTEVLMASLVKYKNIERFIFVSTSEVYGTALEPYITEEHPLNPRSPYAAAKVGADRLVYAYCCTYDVPAVIVRPFNNYGPNQHPEKMMPRFIIRALQRSLLNIHGDGTAERDWVHVYDTCRAFDLILHHENFDLLKHQVINLGSGVATSVLSMAQKIATMCGLTEKNLQHIHERPGQVACHRAATNKAFSLLGWKAEHTLDESLPEIIEWYKQHQSWWGPRECMSEVLVPTPDGFVLQ